MRSLLKRIVLQVSLIVVGFILALAIQAAAFTEPTSNPPAGNVYAPINTGPVSQDKSDPTNDSAWITADGLGSRYGALLATVSGNVGIGTTSPQYPLDIQMNGAIPVVALRANNNADLQWYRNGVGGYMWDFSSRGTNTSPSDSLQLYSNASNPIMAWQQNGNVGIGTTNPGTSGSSLANGPVFQVNGGATYLTPASTNPSQGLELNTNALANGSNGIFISAPSGWSGNLISGNTNGAQQFHVDSSGNAYFAGSVSAGGTVIYSCPDNGVSSGCVGQLTTSNTCPDANYPGGVDSCTPVGHLVQ